MRFSCLKAYREDCFYTSSKFLVPSYSALVTDMIIEERVKSDFKKCYNEPNRLHGLSPCIFRLALIVYFAVDQAILCLILLHVIIRYETKSNV